MGKAKNEKYKNANRHNPLDKEILASRYAHNSSRQKTRGKVPKDDMFVDNRLTNEILKQARKQKEDLEEEEGISTLDIVPHSSLSSSNLPESGDNDEEEYVFCNSEEEKNFQIKAEISEEEAKAFENFMSTNLAERETLADIIKDTLTEKRTEICTIYSDAGSDVLDKNENFFKELAPTLKNYRSGKLPSGFKAIPSSDNWERMLHLTNPNEWSSAAMFQATRIFASNLQDRMAQRFFNKILLPRCRDEIAEHQSLNFHTYQALKKALFKPAAFFKGIIIPLCKSKCSLREATIFASVLAKCSIPVLHSSAALLSIATADYQGANIIIMRTLIEKKYALPYRVVNAVVDYFIGFMEFKETIPVLWYQCLLSFVQIYKFDFSAEQRSGLLKLLNVHNHEKIAPEIRKELMSEIGKELNNTTGLPNVLQQLWKL